jgi:hypothetical protein
MFPTLRGWNSLEVVMVVVIERRKNLWVIRAGETVGMVEEEERKDVELKKEDEVTVD